MYFILVIIALFGYAFGWSCGGCEECIMRWWITLWACIILVAVNRKAS